MYYQCIDIEFDEAFDHVESFFMASVLSLCRHYSEFDIDEYTVVIAYKNTGYKNISVIRTISPGNRFSSYSFVLEEYRL